MRICLVSQEYPPDTSSGGIGAQTYLKAHGLAARGHDIWVVSANRSDVRRECWDGPVRVIRIPGFYSRMRLNTEPVRWLTYSSEVAAAVSQLHSRSHLDLVDFPEYGGEGYIYLLNRTEWDHVPAVVHLHGPLVMFAQTMGWPEPDSEFYRVGAAMESACFRLADAVYSSSQCSTEWCTRYYGARRGPISTIHTGIDLSLFKADDAPKGVGPTIAFAGRIDSNKGIDTLVEAACALAEDFPDLRLLIIGSGDPGFIDSLRGRARESGKSDLLDFAGYVPRQELPGRLNQADVFAAPSVYEGGPGFVYLEAMACGLPVIACEGNGASEMVRHGENGFLIPPRNTRAVVETLRCLLSNADLRRSMGLRARRFVEKEADSRCCLNRLEELYASIARCRVREASRPETLPCIGPISQGRVKAHRTSAARYLRKP